MLTLKTTARFRRDLKRAKKRQMDMDLLETVLTQLLAKQPLDKKYRNHPLSGEYTGFYECHIQPDWLLIYAVDEDSSLLTAARTGTHSDLFGYGCVVLLGKALNGRIAAFSRARSCNVHPVRFSRCA
ncbi:MAG: type II toxin-antitoxin system YafQ family toxin, partial [Burkholderiaceae bacterium]|nr:type II toxin-antitoxin system YafQ family toxin [Burkholderiaceae bacterium]